MRDAFMRARAVWLPHHHYQCWLELFYDLLYVAGMIKLGAITKKAELDQVLYCGLIFSLLW